MQQATPSRGRRLLAGVVDLYTCAYVALLPLVCAGAVFLFLEAKTVGEGVEMARKMPKGVWKADPAKEKELEKARSALFRKLFRDLNYQSQSFLNSLAPRLEEDKAFKETLDKLLQHPYTELASDTYRRAKRALKRHAKTKDGAKALDKVVHFLKVDALRRIFSHVRDELDYRVGQIADYLGFQKLGARIRAMMFSRPRSKAKKGGVPEALHWTNLVDKVISEEVPIIRSTRSNLRILKYAGLFAAILFLLYLVFRDVLGGGQSPGKRYAKLRIVDAASGEPARPAQLATRGLVLAVLLPLEILLAVVGRRIGDRVAGTAVTRIPDEDLRG